MRYLPDLSSDTALLGITRMLSIGTNVAFGVVFLVIVLVTIRRRRPDAWHLLFASSILTLLTALAGPVSQLLLLSQIRGHGARTHLTYLAYVSLGRTLLTAVAMALLLLGLWRLSRPLWAATAAGRGPDSAGPDPGCSDPGSPAGPADTSDTPGRSSAPR